jgi:hypothetical protein
MSTHFRISPPTVKEILGRELGLEKFSRRWVAHLLSDDHQKCRIAGSHELLSLLRACAESNFDTISTGDESWFENKSSPNLMFAEPREKAVPRIRQGLYG